MWKASLSSNGLGGIAANDRYVILGYRDFDDFQDVFQCLDARTGNPVWNLEYLAVDTLDYGLSTRATPSIVDDKVILLGAMGDLHCVQLATGKIIWKHNLKSEFKFDGELPWGYCGSPLITEDKVIVQAGGTDASLVAFDLSDGTLVWKSPGLAPSYGSLIIGSFGGRKQIVGHDATTLGGWDVATGKRLWRLEPVIEGDFNVPTPVQIGDKLLITTENNGTRLYQFQEDGTIDPQPVMENRKLRPDMSSPVVVGNRVFCVNRFLFCLDLSEDLRELARVRDEALGDYGAIIASDNRLLVVGDGQILLVDATSNDCPVLSRLAFSEEKIDAFSHPALVGDRLFLRSGAELTCLQLSP
ncbi:PQQ-binding-like beta-propeller repeat protein [Bremerella sp. P1]|nr:PQQ-binding-like beta-propeller repeat protein [Bremerella sp. P1]WDI45178.1 PQQ-binding-like beta-propeller repeat protein [Bremerella sp. P1]